MDDINLESLPTTLRVPVGKYPSEKKAVAAVREKYEDTFGLGLTVTEIKEKNKVFIIKGFPEGSEPKEKNLNSLNRGELEKIAEDNGIEDPDDKDTYPNKDSLIDAIEDARE